MGYPIYAENGGQDVLVFFDTSFNFIVRNKLVSNHSPILNFAIIPFFVEFGNSQIKQFMQGVFVWENASFSSKAFRQAARLAAPYTFFQRLCGFFCSPYLEYI